MNYNIAVNFGNFSTNATTLLVWFPVGDDGATGVGHIYEGDVAIHEGSPSPELEAEILAATRNMGNVTPVPGSRLPREFGAEEVYNMLITTLFLLFVLTTVALLIFLLMRKPPCCLCCQDTYETSASTNGDNSSQTAHIPYLTETHGIVVKKWMKDSPPPYESPPDYNSLSPELIMDAKTLQDLVNSSQSQSVSSSSSQAPAGVYTTATSTASCQERSSSPLCTTPLFSSCDSPRSLTPTIMPESKIRPGYDGPPSPIFTRHYISAPPCSSVAPSTATCSSFTTSTSTSTACAAVPSSMYGEQQQHMLPPPAYESLRLYSRDGTRIDNQ